MRIHKLSRLPKIVRSMVKSKAQFIARDYCAWYLPDGLYITQYRVNGRWVDVLLK